MELEHIPMRDGYGKALLELCKTHDDIMVLDADVAKSTRTDWVKRDHPDKFLDLGISEQDMIGTASGLALAGITPFASTYGVFITGRAWDQIRNTVCYNRLNVKIAGAHGGISVGPDGATHQALEDIALMRVLPEMTVVVPCDSIETYKATKAIHARRGPCYIRFGREPVPVVTDESTPFEIGKAHTMREGTDAVIFACGFMVYQSLEAAKLLETQGISVMVVNVHTIKPFDKTAILAAARQTGAVTVCEEHQRSGGLGGAICELLSERICVPISRVGISDTFGESGTPDELIARYGLGITDVVYAVKQALGRKK